ncbi:hypothetical protein BDR05DRAFT_609511 [Suillus weaverae]|nr:hypothetical protein BDR05DRAFT_609511 [Suillus weaverae]
MTIAAETRTLVVERCRSRLRLEYWGSCLRLQIRLLWLRLKHCLPSLRLRLHTCSPNLRLERRCPLRLEHWCPLRLECRWPLRFERWWFAFPSLTPSAAPLPLPSTENPKPHPWSPPQVSHRPPTASATKHA